MADAVTIPATVGKIPSTERRVTTLASVYAGESKTPIVRTANASFIDGVEDSPGSKTATADSQKSTSSAFPWIIAGVVVLLILVAGAAVLVVLRSRRRRLRRGSPLR